MKYNWNEIQDKCTEISIITEAEAVESMMREGFKYTINDANGNIVSSIYDVCGNAHIIFKDRRSGFAKEYKKFIESLDSIYSVDVFMLYMKPSRQELKVNKAVAQAVADYLNEKYDANVYIRWYED